MKIAYLSEVRIPSKAASVVHVLKMCESLTKLGHNVTLFYAENGSFEGRALLEEYGIEGGFEMVGVGRARVRGIVYLYGLKIAWQTRKRNVHLALCRSLWGGTVCAALGVPVIYEAHMPTREKGLVTHSILQVFLKLKDSLGLVVISEALERYFKTTYDLGKKRILVVPDAAAELPCDGQDGLELRRSDKLNVGYIGHLYEGRGIGLLLEIARNCSWLHMHIVGGEKEAVSYWKLKANGLDNITFYGHVPFSDTERYRRLCDVLVAPYEMEVRVSGNKSNTADWMSPLKIFEYMASRKAIVCSDLPVIREVLSDGGNAVLCKVGDVEEWCAALKRLADCKDLREELAGKAYTTYRDQYTWDQRAERIVGAFSDS